MDYIMSLKDKVKINCDNNITIKVIDKNNNVTVHHVAENKHNDVSTLRKKENNK